MNKNAETYFTEGCGRCSLYATPKCKVLTWKKELSVIRKMLLSTTLKEELKWGSPYYTYNGSNVIMIQSFKAYCALTFFKGTLIKDPEGILVKDGVNSNSARQIRFSHAGQVKNITKAKVVHQRSNTD